ncbi:hypothetical protein HanXRQr2_Chr13g0569491 [Helianthus annuus]|uniref:Uncharacterized protein n=1 Tax=Helianthus annuus TaxID=4232 RepID=A0A251SNZ9_HELAN|nr:hypothetical protein HanXRQr2_Chr13g0569491 [Helianthus annuus]
MRWIFYLHSYGFLLFVTFYLVFCCFTHLYSVALYWSFIIWFVRDFLRQRRKFLVILPR